MNEKELYKRMQNLADFVPGSGCPAPSLREGGMHVDDLLSVAAGKRKIGFLNGVDEIKDWRSLKKFMDAHGVHLKTIRLWCEEDKTWDYTVAAASDPKLFEELETLLTRKNPITWGEYTTKMGQLLGYPEELIKSFMATKSAEDLTAIVEPMFADSSSWWKNFTTKNMDVIAGVIGKNPETSLIFCGATSLLGAVYAGHKVADLLSEKKKTASDEKKSGIRDIAQLALSAYPIVFGALGVKTALKGSCKQFM